MSPSRPFILRPVATSLLMAAILLVGIVSYTQLPVSALPEVDYPTIQVLTFYPGASPQVMATTVTAPLERQFGQLQGLEPDDLDELGRDFGDRAAVQPEPEYRRRGRRGAVGDQCVAELSAGEPAGAADLQQDESCRCAGADAGDHVEDDAAFAGGGSGRHAACAEDLAAERRGTGEHQRRTEACGAHSGESDGALVVRHQSGRSADGGDAEQRECGEGQLRRAAAGLSDRRERSAGDEQGLQERGRRVPQRRAGDADRRCEDRGWRGEHDAGRVDGPDAGGHSECAAPARRQHDQRGQEHQAAAAAAGGESSQGDRGHDAYRPDDADPGVGERCGVRADADGRPGGAGHLSVSAKSLRDDYSERGGSAVAGRHVRRDVPARLQPGQPFADGADDLDGLRGR